MTEYNGAGARVLPDGFISAFMDYTDNQEASELYRRWCCIALLGAVLEQKVWAYTSAEIYANMYVFLVGESGIGKSKSIVAAKKLLRGLPEPFIAPTSMTSASLVDELEACHRHISRRDGPPLDYHSMSMMIDDIGAFMSEYKEDIVGNMTQFYDAHPYGQSRRGRDIKIKMEKPQLSILCGATTPGLIRLVPESAWEQGFCSRMTMVYSDEHILAPDIFGMEVRDAPHDMIHDLRIINELVGLYSVTTDYRNAINNWRHLGYPPVPAHPKLRTYNSRRFIHLVKLSMISAVDKSNTLVLTKDDFNRAMGWLLEVEKYMPKVFAVGGIGGDARAMDELLHFVSERFKAPGVPESTLYRRARELVPATAVGRMIEVMQQSAMIKITTQVKGIRYFGPA